MQSCSASCEQYLCRTQRYNSFENGCDMNRICDNVSVGFLKVCCFRPVLDMTILLVETTIAQMSTPPAQIADGLESLGNTP